ncbi:MAG TPA: ABC transporter permease [Acidimicrobiia bacterium]|nr:ABC transporter permease [Acidimicrobiia bacterium]
MNDPAIGSAGTPPPPPSSRRRGPVEFVTSTFRRSPSLVIGASIIIVLSVLAMLAPVLSPYDPFALDPLQRFLAPSADHWFGTDELGRDIWTRSLYGARVSLSTAFLAVMIGMAIGVPLGLLSGYFGKWVDGLIMRYVDIQIAVPGILLAMMIILFVGRGFFALVVAIGIGSIPNFARIVRASTLSIQEEEYVAAVKALGGGHLYTMFRTILPNALGPIIVQAVITAAVAVLLEAALSFLGLGTVPPTPSWGAMLQTGKGYMNEAAHYSIMPGVLLTITVIALDLMGRGMQKLRGSSASATAELEGRA